MEAIDQATFNFSPTIGLAVAVMVGFLVFAVALALSWEQFQRVLEKPKAPGIGLVAQYLILPGVAFGVGRSWPTPRALRSGCCSSPVVRPERYRTT